MKVQIYGGCKNEKRGTGKIKHRFIYSYLLPLLFLAHLFNTIPSCKLIDSLLSDSWNEGEEKPCPQTYCNAPNFVKVALLNVFQKDSIEYGIRRLKCFNIEKEKMIVCMGGGTFPIYYLKIFGEGLTPEMRQTISNYIYMPVPAVHFYDIDRNKLWMEKLEITPFSCAYVEDKDKIYCAGVKGYYYHEKNIDSYPPAYIYEYDYKTGVLRKTETRLPTFAEIKESFRKFGYCDLDKDPTSDYCVCDDEVKDYYYPSTDLCYSDSVYPGLCVYVKERKKIYCLGSSYGGHYGRRYPLDFIFEYDPFEDKLRILDVRVEKVEDRGFIAGFVIPGFMGIVHFPEIGRIIGTETTGSGGSDEGLTPNQFLDKYSRTFPFFDYEKMETGFLNWRFPKSEKTGYSYFLYTNCVYSSLKKSIFCIGGEGLGFEELDSVVQFMPDGRARVVGSIYYAVNRWKDYEWEGMIIRKGDTIENGPWYELDCVEGYNKKIYCFGGFTSYATGGYPALGVSVLEIDVSEVPEW